MARFRDYVFLTVIRRHSGYIPAVTVEMGLDEHGLDDALTMSRMLRPGTVMTIAAHRAWEDGRTETYRWEIDIADDQDDLAEAAQ